MRGDDLAEPRETGRTAFAKARERAAEIDLPVAALVDPADGIDRRECRSRLDDHAEAGREIFRFFVSQVADNLDWRPLFGQGSRARRRVVQILEERVQNSGQLRELATSFAEERRRIDRAHDAVHPPSTAMIEPVT